MLGVGGDVGYGGCESRVKGIVFFLGGVGGRVGGGRVGGGVGSGGGDGMGGGVRVDVIEELKFLGKFTKKKMGGGR